MDVRATASLPAFAAPAAAPAARVGFVVPRYKHSAVDRNRLKRRLRELVRTQVLSDLPPWDVVVRVFPVAYTRSFDELAAELRQAMTKLTRELRHESTRDATRDATRELS
jgi:ribonuclease P protein component